jgi:hypothetical protein
VQRSAPHVSTPARLRDGSRLGRCRKSSQQSSSALANLWQHDATADSVKQKLRLRLRLKVDLQGAANSWKSEFRGMGAGERAREYPGWLSEPRWWQLRAPFGFRWMARGNTSSP